MKKLFKVLLTFCFTMMLFSCGIVKKPSNPIVQGTTKLETPIINEAFGKIVKWGEINNAISYNVSINETNETVTTNNYEVNLATNGDFTIKVQAVAKENDPVYCNSLWSNDYTFSYDTNAGIYNKKNAIELKNSKLGSSINTLNASYMANNSILKKNFIDINKLSNTVKIGTKENITKTPYIEFNANSMDSFANKVASSYFNANGIDLGYPELKDNFGLSNSLVNYNDTTITRNANTKEYFSLAYKALPDKRKYLEDFDLTTFKTNDLLTKDAKDKLDSMKDLTGDALDEEINSLFTTFGTHIITDATYGGKIETSYYAKTNNELVDYQVMYASIYKILEKEKLENIKIPNNPNELDPMFNIDHHDANIATSFNVRVFGGDEFNASTIKELNDNFDAWLESYTDEADHLTMIDINHGGLVAFWDLIPDEYSRVARRMKVIYKNTIKDNNKQLLDAYKYNDTYTDDYTNFSGGNGTINHPYIISDVDQLNKIREDAFNTPNTYFELSEDIDLSQKKFEPIYVFNANIDGKNHTIKNFEQISEDVNLVELGLFLNNKGTIKNITLLNEFNKENISFSYKPKTLNKTSVTIGGFVASNNGTMINCHTKNTNIYASYKSSYTYEYDNLNIGGIAGINNGTISYCSADGFILETYHKCNDLQYDASINTYGGGIVGFNTKTGIIENCFTSNNDLYMFSYGSYSDAWDNGHNYINIEIGGIAGHNNNIVKNVFTYNNKVRAQYDHVGNYYVIEYSGGNGRYIGLNSQYLLDSSYVEVSNRPIIGKENGISKNCLILEKEEDIIYEYNYDDFLYLDKTDNSIKFRYLNM